MELKPITRHAMGMQVELGTLFDARSSTFYSSYSLWNLTDIKKHQRETAAPDTKFSFSSSLKDTRQNSGLDAEGSVGVDFGIFELSGSAKYLEDKQRNSNEARVDVTCTRVNQTRAIPMEVMTKMTHNDLILSRPEITHFVSEVKEGAVGNITFIKRCGSADEVKEISGSLSGVLKKSIASLKGNMTVDWKKGEKENYEDIQIYVEGAITEAVTNVEDAARVGKQLPQMLSGINNTLTMTLLPISNLDAKVKRLVRKIDDDLLIKVSNMLTNAKIAGAEVLELQELAHMEMFPKIKEQCLSFQEAFNRNIASFRQTVGETLPNLKDGSQKENVFKHKLLRVVEIMRQHVNIAKKFVSIKKAEGHFLGKTVKNLEGKGLRNYLKEECTNYITGDDREQVMLNLYVAQSRHHHLEKQLAEVSQKGDDTVADGTDSDEDEALEWFQDDQSKLHNACTQFLESYKKNANAKLEFGFCSVSKAYSEKDGGNQRIKTCIGDMILKSNGKDKVISDLKVAMDNVPAYDPKAPFNVKVSYDEIDCGPEYGLAGSFKVSWDAVEDKGFPITSFLVRYRYLEDGSAWVSEKVKGKARSFESHSWYDSLSLAQSSDTDGLYEFEVSTIWEGGSSIPCAPVKVRK